MYSTFLKPMISIYLVSLMNSKCQNTSHYSSKAILVMPKYKRYTIDGAVKVSIVRPWPNVRFLREASDWSIIVISNFPNSLTGSRGEYFRVCWNP